MKEEIEVLAQFSKGNIKIVKFTAPAGTYSVHTTIRDRSIDGAQDFKIQGSGFNAVLRFEYASFKWYITELNNL